MGKYKDRDIKKRIKKLREIIGKYLDGYVKIPAFETIEKDLYVQGKLGHHLSLLNVTVDHIMGQGLDFDKDYLVNLQEPEANEHKKILNEFIQTGQLSQNARDILKTSCSKKYLFPFLVRELNWIVISILSASYISANVLMRSVFELLIGIATKNTGKMQIRIDKIAFFTPEEKKAIKALWDNLSTWAHPAYRKNTHPWAEEVCPVFISHKPMYHPKLCEQCLEYFEKLVDFLLVVGIEKFEIDLKDVFRKKKHLQFDVSDFTLFNKRYHNQDNTRKWLHLLKE